MSKRDTIRQAFAHGREDRGRYGLLIKENLYRRPWWLRLAWQAGWMWENDQPGVIPLRNERKQ